MAASGAMSPTIEAFQKVEDYFMDWVVASLDERDSAQQPKNTYEKEIVEEEAFISRAFERVYQSQDRDEQKMIACDIVHRAKELGLMEVKCKDATEVSKVRYRHILQRLCDKMFPVFGPTCIRRSLEQIPRDEINLYLPRASLSSVEGDAMQPKLGQSAEPRRVGEDISQEHGVPEEEASHPKLLDGNTEQRPSKKRRINTTPHLLESVEDRCLREELGEEVDPDGIPHQNVGAQTARKTAVDGTVSTKTTVATKPPANVDTLLEIADAEGTHIGWVRPSDTWKDNNRIRTVAGLPIQRRVTIRQRRTDAFQIVCNELLCDQTKANDTKVLSCLIQATGEVMDAPCKTCKGNRGPFEDCIKLQQSRIPNCGNCEWNRNGCRGASTTSVREAGRNASDEGKGAETRPLRDTAYVSNDLETQIEPSTTKLGSQSLGPELQGVDSASSLQRPSNCMAARTAVVDPKNSFASPSQSSPSSPNWAPVSPRRLDPITPGYGPKSPSLHLFYPTFASQSSVQMHPPSNVFSQSITQTSGGNGASLVRPPDSVPSPQGKQRSESTMSNSTRAHPQSRVEEGSETDSESRSGNTVAGSTDFRIYQVKDRHFTTDKGVTQYLTWVDEAQCFKHKVLKGTNPVQWGVLRDPVNLSIRLSEVSEMRWSVQALCVHFIMKSENVTASTLDGAPRGDVMAVFKSETILRRFLKFCRTQKLSTTEGKRDELVTRWSTMPSQYLLSDLGDEASATWAMMC